MYIGPAIRAPLTHEDQQAHLDGLFPQEVSVRLCRRVRTSVRSGLHLIGRPRAVGAEGRRTEAPEEVEVGGRGVGDLADVRVQRRAAAPILHEVPPPVCRQEVSVLRGKFVQALRGVNGFRLPALPRRAPGLVAHRWQG